MENSWKSIRTIIPSLTDDEKIDLLSVLCSIGLGEEPIPSTDKVRLVVPFITNVTPVTAPVVKEVKTEKKVCDMTLFGEESNRDWDLGRQVKDDWNSICASQYIPKITKISAHRMKKLKARLNEMAKIGEGDGYTIMKQCMYIIDQSDFASGRKGGWKATFDWFIESEANWTKLYEGNYNNTVAVVKDRKDMSRIEIEEEGKKMSDIYYDLLAHNGLTPDQFTYAEFERRIKEYEANGGSRYKFTVDANEIMMRAQAEDYSRMQIEGYYED